MSTKRPSILLWQMIIAAIFCTLANPIVDIACGEVIGCDVGDTSQGYWQIVGNLGLGKCIIPGSPDPDSANTFSGVHFRIEGLYKVSTYVEATFQNEYTPPAECPPPCISSGYREWICNYLNATGHPYRRWYVENSLVVDEYDDGTIRYKRYTCYVDTNYVSLYKWTCNAYLPEEQTKNQNFASPCPPGECCDNPN